MKRAHRGSVSSRRAIGLAVTTVVGFGVLAPAQAQSPADQWAAAIREQKEAIATNRSSRARCASNADPRCAALVDRARLMEENLGRLERQHARMVGAPPPIRTSSVGAPPPARTSSTAVAERPTDRRVRTETPPGLEPRRPAPVQQRSLFSMLFGGGGTTQAPRSEVRIDGEEVASEAGADSGSASGDGWGARSGSYRTLCVRTCDGYFFPVSFNASRDRLKTDANVCKALCPQADTRLYYHDASGQEAENAVAADDGSPLVQMSNAFLYRRTRVSDCTCGTPDPRTLPVQAGGLAGARMAFARAAIEVPLPRVRPSPDQDPATQAIELGATVAEAVAPSTPIPEESAARLAAAADTAQAEPPKVRIVGPKWLSDR
jgi:hypothetical protein